MRQTFSELLFEELNYNKDIIVVTADLGYGMWDKIKDTFASNYYNVGSAEQLMTGVCIGLAENKKIPIAYSITPFLLCRPYELIRNYINNEKIPVKLVGSGRDNDYEHDGFSHYAYDDEKILSNFENVVIYKPTTINELKEQFLDFLYNKKPSYLNLKR